MKKAFSRNLLIFFVVVIALMFLSDFFVYVIMQQYSEVIRVDGKGYYAYLPAVFIYQDLSFDFIKDTSEFLVNGVNRYSVGVAICWIPFWLMGHALSILFGIRSGYGKIYEMMILLSGIFYWIVGILCTYKVLIKRFSEYTSLLTCVIMTLGTRLFHYSTIDSCLSHTYSFAVIALFMLTCINYVEHHSKVKALLAGMLLGLITDIRNVNVVVALIPIVLILENEIKKGLNKRIFIDLICAIAGFLIMLLPMILYWKISSGHWIYNSYGQWSFDWVHPQVLQVLFGEDTISGMFKLSPLLLLIFPGAYIMMKKSDYKFTSISLIICLLIDLYLVCACWTPAGVGRRAYVNYLSIMAIPFSYFIEKTENNIFVKRNSEVVIIIGILWNFVEIIHYWFYW